MIFLLLTYITPSITLLADQFLKYFLENKVPIKANTIDENVTIKFRGVYSATGTLLGNNQIVNREAK